MKTSLLKACLKLIVLILVWLTVQPISSGAQMNMTAPKNIILMIGDGCGYNQFQAATYYRTGLESDPLWSSFPVRLGVSTYPAAITIEPLVYSNGYSPDKAWKERAYITLSCTNSPGAATAIASGVKTYNDAVGVDLNKQPLTTITDVAKFLQKSAGVVTTVPFAHATPAGFVAHSPTRSNYPEIAKQMLLESKMDVIMGCGHPYYSKDGKPVTRATSFSYVGDSLLWTQLQQPEKADFIYQGIPYTLQDVNFDGAPDPWKLLITKDDFQRLMTDNPPPPRVLGLPQVYSTLQQERTYDSTKVDPYATPFIQHLPDLTLMTQGALNVLGSNPNGFFIMIEGGAIDWACHDNQKGRMIEETIDFTDAIKAVMEWVETNSSWEETLLIVTADHECGNLGSSSSSGSSSGSSAGEGALSEFFKPIVNNGKGVLPGMEFRSTDHTNSLVPLFAKGVGSDVFSLFADEFDPVRGAYITNSEIGQVMFLLWGNKTE
ncbi:MAG: alkaline phosphatase [Bacteroidetes bacterium]|nr:alkaline phosphatase [Bacteroidota bacterium]